MRTVRKLASGVGSVLVHRGSAQGLPHLGVGPPTFPSPAIRFIVVSRSSL